MSSHHHQAHVVGRVTAPPKRLRQTCRHRRCGRGKNDIHTVTWKPRVRHPAHRIPSTPVSTKGRSRDRRSLKGGLGNN
eukprot:6731166-Prymnesium_polylepis.2